MTERLLAIIFVFINSVISGNNAAVKGGGVFSSGTLTLTNTMVSNNGATTGGGGIYSSAALIATGCTIQGNSASHGSGGGILSSSLSDGSWAPGGSSCA